ncbi:hypothetical protein CHLNCDRAFT_28812 [Chlorella variabilis]|uniref:O-acyltransferase n=1 Tax=Chlorella variabilis TaxID=554065 RepID=E1ZTZ7_CHLVA|nr:hypothetical protein CHLNCDRAFT_28812 [Chlorella variabilis]EFN50697.1 hypothetical protein CHLNCDRAFT_28812 [Chlorella variabilis]|eukprot:XP_005842809.1 hypothetical protein CHLNCDRAFT_28812 [Chlorella variabilis]
MPHHTHPTLTSLLFSHPPPPLPSLPPHPHPGVITLVFLILAATNFRLILENMIKYRLRFNPLTFLRTALTPSGNLPLLLCWPLLACFALCALGIERFAHLVFLLNLLNTSAALLAPCAIILHTRAELLPGFALTMATIVLWLKLVSYAHVNWDYRWAVCPGERGSGVVPEGVEEELRYPENIVAANLAYFLLAPTLCYQLTYPRSKRFRARWMAKKLLMLTGGLGLMLFSIEQYIQPTIDNSMRPLREMDWLRMLERILKLSIPTLYWWLAMFYTLFDLWLNIIAELLRFGDREFYKEWWNATTVGEYWRLWNQPVHKWMLRHVYFPLIRHGVPKFHAGLMVFFVSAVFHEVLVGVPLHMLRLWAFWGLMMQVPLMIVTEWLKGRLRSDRVGNIIFWVSFCFVGQPLAMILYYHDFRQVRCCTAAACATCIVAVQDGVGWWMLPG